MASSDDWKSPGFRQNVAARIEEAIRQSGNPTPKTASEMETHFFQRATNKEEYLSYLARLLIHIKELGSKHRTQGGVGVPGQANPQQQQGNLPQGQMMNQMNNVRPQNQLNMLLDQQQKNVMVPNQQQQMNQQQMVSNQHQQMNQMNSNPQQQQMNPMAAANPQQQMNQMVPNSQQQQMNQMAPNQQQQQMNQMAPNQQQQQMNQMAQNPQQQMNSMASNPQQQMNTMAANPQQQQINQMNVNQQQQMNQMAANQQQQMNQQQMMGNQQQQQIGMNQGMNQFNPNSNMNVGNPLMQQLGTPNQQIGNNPGSALLSQLNQSQQQAMAGPMNAGMQRARFPVPAGAVPAGNKLIPPPQQQQQQQQVQQQQLLNQQLMMQRKQQNEMVNQGPGTPQFVSGPGVPSPAMQQGPMSSGMGGAHMGAPSPAYVHSPGNVQHNSPATAARMAGPQQQQQQRGVGGLLPPPSPSMMNIPTPGGGGMLHTPQGAGMGGGIQGPPSIGSMNMSGAPGGGGGGTGVMNEDQLYLEKVRQLSRFIEPLTRLISRFGDEDSEKLSKMKIMLDILSNPNKRMPMDTLLKCEAVLEKMDFKRSETGSVAPPSVASVPSLGVAVPAAKDQPPASGLHPLLETIANQAKSPYINHTLQRTFAPSVNALIGCDIAPPSLKRRQSDRDQDTDDATDELMDTIEREIANMDPRFQVDLNQLHLLGSQDVHLTCRLDDKCLPFVPPLRIVVPREYPRTAPIICDSQQQDYESSPFTRTVLKGLNDRLRHMPHRYSVSQILNCWEMALRHACKPNSTHPEIPPLISAFGL